jgi:hypothetical protein
MNTIMLLFVFALTLGAILSGHLDLVPWIFASFILALSVSMALYGLVHSLWEE